MVAAAIRTVFAQPEPLRWPTSSTPSAASSAVSSRRWRPCCAKRPPTSAPSPPPDRPLEEGVVDESAGAGEQGDQAVNILAPKRAFEEQ